jgi:hypothetical protein
VRTSESSPTSLRSTHRTRWGKDAVVPAPPGAPPSPARASRCTRDTPLGPCTRRRRAARPCNARGVPARSRAPACRTPGIWRSPAPHTGAGLSPPRWPPPTAWRGCPSPPRTAPSPPASSAGRPIRAPPPAPPHPHLVSAHLPSASNRLLVSPERPGNSGR